MTNPNVKNHRYKALAAACLMSAALFGCKSLPQAGPTRESITTLPAASGIRLVAAGPEHIARQAANRAQTGFARRFVDAPAALSFGTGDVLEVSIWEAPPALLFGGSESLGRAALAMSGARGISLPPQTLGADGSITVPFVGEVLARGRKPSEIAADITRGLKGKAHLPQVMVRKVESRSAMVTVVGEVTSNTRLPLTDRAERVLDALAAAGGSRHPPHKTSIQLTRDGVSSVMLLERLIREPEHNIALRPADIVTAIYQSSSFTALGATSQNAEINFEAQGITLAQGLARLGGLQDFRADAQGVFVFRMEPSESGSAAAASLVPVVYQFDLKKPEGLILAQQFLIQDKDMLYVSNAPAADWQKFANLIYTIALPAIGTVNTIRQ
jgi:polysaccharide biosynthesis/export protein